MSSNLISNNQHLMHNKMKKTMTYLMVVIVILFISICT